MWCPKCKSEFREGFTECPACKVPLVESLEEAEKPAEAVEPVLLMSFQDRNELELAAGVLDRAGIPYLLKEPGSGEYLRIVTGQNMFGTELYVDPRVQRTALRLLRRYDQEEAAEFDDDALNAAIDEFESEYPDEAKPEEAASGSEGYQTLLIFLAVFGLIALAAVAIPFLRSLALS